MKIDNALISKLEKLSRLELTEAERSNIKEDLNNILGMVEKLNQLDTSSVEPLTHISRNTGALRKDEVKHQLDKSTSMQNAPKTDGDFFLVPKVIKQRQK